MRIEFRDNRLGLVRTDRAAETKLPFPVIKSAREKLIVIEAAPDERVLRNWKSLHYEKLEGEKDGKRFDSNQQTMADGFPVGQRHQAANGHCAGNRGLPLTLGMRHEH